MTEPASFCLEIETAKVVQRVELVGGENDTIQDIMEAYLEAIREGNLVDYA